MSKALVGYTIDDFKYFTDYTPLAELFGDEVAQGVLGRAAKMTDAATPTTKHTVHAQPPGARQERLLRRYERDPHVV